MTELDQIILELAKKGVLAGDICIKLNITKEEFKERLQIIKSILNVYKEETDLTALSKTNVM